MELALHPLHFHHSLFLRKRYKKGSSERAALIEAYAYFTQVRKKIPNIFTRMKTKSAK